VHCVLTQQDIPGELRHGLVEYDWPAFAGGDYPARYVGDPIALVVADTNELAHDALKLIKVEYEVLPAVTDPVAARRPDAPVLHPDRPTGNLLKHIKVRHGDLEAGFAAADVIVERTYRTPMTEHAFLEPECSVAVPAGWNDPRYGAHEKLTIYVGSQIPYADRDQVARCLGLPKEAVRVKGTVMGGGFGGKEDIAGQFHAALAAQVTGARSRCSTRARRVCASTPSATPRSSASRPAPRATVCSPRSRPNSTATAAPTPAWAKR
jgi:CO/xanthine dehydrogenase Mo-binding subunit